MTAGERLAAAARRYLGTPFHHQGRVQGAGVDCMGLIICAARDAGLDVGRDHLGYPPGSAGHDYRQSLAEACRLWSPDEWESYPEGAILVFESPALPGHVAISSRHGCMIHARAGIGRVVETCIDYSWHRRVAAVYLPINEAA